MFQVNYNGYNEILHFSNIYHPLWFILKQVEKHGGRGGGTRTFLHYIFDNVSRAKPFWKKRTTSRSFRIPYSLRFYTIHNQRTRLASSICNVPLEIQDRTHIRKLLYIVTRRYVFEFTLRILSIVINYQSRVP